MWVFADCIIQKYRVNYSILSSVRINSGIQMVDGDDRWWKKRGRNGNPPDCLYNTLVKQKY